jgi:hypothetical protein
MKQSIPAPDPRSINVSPVLRGGCRYGTAASVEALHHLWGNVREILGVWTHRAAQLRLRLLGRVAVEVADLGAGTIDDLLGQDTGRVRGAHDRVFVVERALAHATLHDRPIVAGPWLHAGLAGARQFGEGVRRESAIQITIRIVAGEAAAALGPTRGPVAVLEIPSATEKLQVARAARRFLVHRRAAQLAQHGAVFPDRFQ